MPGSETVAWRRWATFAAVMPVASSLALLRCGSRPNSGQSSSRCAVAELAAGATALGLVVGVETAAGALEPQAARSRHAIGRSSRRGLGTVTRALFYRIELAVFGLC